MLSVRVAEQRFLSQIQHMELKEALKLVFSGNDGFLYVGTNNAILKFLIKTGSLIKRYPIPSIYSILISLQTNFEGTEAMILCKKSDSKVTSLLKITKMKEQVKDNILFTNESGLELRGRVSQDFKRVFLNNDEDNIYYEDNKQMQLTHFNHQNVFKVIEVPYKPAQTTQQLGDDLVIPVLQQNHSIQNTENTTTAFLCICSNPYDNFIKVLHSHESDFVVKIDRQVTNKNYSYMDIVYKDGEVKILSCRDEELFVDSFNLDQAFAAIASNSKPVIQNQYDTPFKSFEFQWPLLAFIFQNTSIMLLSMHIPKTIFRFALKNKNESIANITITHALELFYATINEQTQKFSVYKIAGTKNLLETGCENFATLDAEKKFTINWFHSPIFSYHLAEVNENPLYQLWIKSSSLKNARGKSDCRYFVLHKQALFTYVEGENLKLVAGDITHARYANEDTIYYEKIDPSKGSSTKWSVSLNRVSIVYSALRLEVVYEEKRPDAKIQNYSIDYSLNRIYILCKFRVGQQFDREMLILDASNFSILSRFDMSEAEMYGPFKAGIHFLINGNLYYQNSIARMDPLNAQHKLFTVYEDIIPIQGYQQMLFLSPKISIAQKKVLYIKKDRGNSALRTGIILPYLDERLIVFGEQSKGSSVWTIAEGTFMGLSAQSKIQGEANGDIPNAKILFDNSVHHDESQFVQPSVLPKQEEDSQLKRCSFLQRGINKVQIKRSTKNMLSEVEVQYRDQQRILHINHSEGKIFIYSIKGMLLNAMPFFNDLKISYGDCVASSQSGLVLVFRTSENLKYTVRKFDFRLGFQQILWEANILELIENDQKLLSLLLGDLAHQFANLKIASKEVPFTRKDSNNSQEQPLVNAGGGPNMITEIDQFAKQSMTGDSKDDQGTQNAIGEAEYLEKLSSALMNKFNFKIDVNNDGDIGFLLIEKRNKRFSSILNMIGKRLQNNLQQDDKKLRILLVAKQQQQTDISLKKTITSKRKVGTNGSSNLDGPTIQFFTNRSDFASATFIKKFIITREHLVFWNMQSIFLISHMNPHLSSKRSVLKTIDFKIPFKELKRNSISEVSIPGTNARDSVVVFKIKYTHNQANLIIWDLKGNIELDSYDVTCQSKVIFDANEEVYVLENDHIIMNDSGGRCFAYQLENSGYLDFIEESTDQIKIDRGLRIDRNHQNYMLIKDQLHISHSYLGILINEKNALKEYTNRTFDPLAFPYYFNQRSELHHYITDPQAIDLILQNYEERDSRLLDHILLITKERATPLHFAVVNDISKSLNLLLKKLSVVRVNNTDNFKDVFDNFLDYGFFADYLNVNYFQSTQMKSIQSMNIPRLSNSDEHGAIVVENNNTFVTQELFLTVVKDSAPNQPVTVKGFDLYWILNSEEGRNFLHKLSNHENVNFFTTEYIQTLITFLWGHFKRQIIIWVMIPYIAYFSFFIALIFYNEDYLERGQRSSEEPTIIGLCSALVLMIFYFKVILLRKCLTLGRYSVYSFWAWLNFVSNSLNLAIVIMVYQQSQDKELQIRRIEALASVLMWFRFLYFFRLIDQTAPLIRMIWQIIYDIRAFIFIFILIILAFANGFWVLSKNQIALSKDADPSELPYYTYRLSVLYVFLTAVGEYGVDNYSLGVEEENYLWALFILTVFFLSIVLLNMLIAIMGQSYERVSYFAQAQMMRERILLIMENFFLQKSGAFSKAKYLIAITPTQQENDEHNEAIIEEIRKAVLYLGQQKHLNEKHAD
ncbi:hypothetical protein FGO68_gene12312 [Halteria grandinella]|uniref:Ion transport domain-containing protein n=1 Tax=Halteria grandinella TaxID=5974 RepID=A0A8J8P5F1_HALGN|nr:hypothetical protein FGO68_gene12312 [Halteria grandinella]